jgi:hypothetical protein
MLAPTRRQRTTWRPSSKNFWTCRGSCSLHLLLGQLKEFPACQLTCQVGVQASSRCHESRHIPQKIKPSARRAACRNVQASLMPSAGAHSQWQLPHQLLWELRHSARRRLPICDLILRTLLDLPQDQCFIAGRFVTQVALGSCLTTA